MGWLPPYLRYSLLPYVTLLQGLHSLYFKNIGTGTETGKFQHGGGRGREGDREGEGGEDMC